MRKPPMAEQFLYPVFIIIRPYLMEEGVPSAAA